MNAGYFVVIVLVSGFVAGTIHGAVNLAIVEPYLDEAIGIENQNLFVSGEAEDTPQFWSLEGSRLEPLTFFIITRSLSA